MKTSTWQSISTGQTLSWWNARKQMLQWVLHRLECTTSRCQTIIQHSISHFSSNFKKDPTLLALVSIAYWSGMETAIRVAILVWEVAAKIANPAGDFWSLTNRSAQHVLRDSISKIRHVWHAITRVKPVLDQGVLTVLPVRTTKWQFFHQGYVPLRTITLLYLHMSWMKRGFRSYQAGSSTATTKQWMLVSVALIPTSEATVSVSRLPSYPRNLRTSHTILLSNYHFFSWLWMVTSASSSTLFSLIN